MIHDVVETVMRTVAPDGIKKRNFLISFVGVYTGQLWKMLSCAVLRLSCVALYLKTERRRRRRTAQDTCRTRCPAPVLRRPLPKN